MRIRAAFLLFLLAFSSSQARVLNPLYASTQLIVVTTSDWNAVEGKLQRYERAAPGGKWQAVGEPFSVVVGKNGLGWGSGISAVDHDSDDPIKKEGDGKAPAGVFRLTTSF